MKQKDMVKDIDNLITDFDNAIANANEASIDYINKYEKYIASTPDAETLKNKMKRMVITAVENDI